MRILLWDIDGTLIRSARTGGYKDYTIPVLEEIFGTAGRLADLHVSGMTDLQIVFEALSDAGISQDEILARAEVLVSRLTEEARRVTGNGAKFFELLPGVRETLEALAAHPRYSSALVTGNIKPMAELKMELVGLGSLLHAAGRVWGRVAQSSRSSGARGGAYPQTSANGSRAGTVHRHRRHAERHRLRASLRRARRRCRNRTLLLDRRNPRL